MELLQMMKWKIITYQRKIKIMKNLVILIILLTINIVKGQVNQYDKPNNQTYQSTYVPTDVDFYERMAKEKQRQEYEKEKAHLVTVQQKVNRLKQIYYDAGKYPETIPDGFYNVEITDNVDMCFGPIQVYVEGNKITYQSKDGVKDDPTTFSSQIVKGKAVFKFNIPGAGSSPYIDAYFIEYIYK